MCQPQSWVGIQMFKEESHTSGIQYPIRSGENLRGYRRGEISHTLHIPETPTHMQRWRKSDSAVDLFLQNPESFAILKIDGDDGYELSALESWTPYIDEDRN